MRADDIGTSDDSIIYSNTPSAVAKELYLYPIYVGHYYCDSRYRVERNNFDSFLFLYVKNGSGYAEIKGRKYHLSAGNVILLDCYAPHKYYTTTSWEIVWVHFDGVMARKLYEYATPKSPVVTPFNLKKLISPLNTLLDIFENQLSYSEAYLSKYLVDLMTEFIVSSVENESAASQNMRIEEAVKYISEHLQEDINLPQLAEKAMLSPFYFSRLFKQKTGFTPYQYLITVRLDYSCYLLRTSTFTVKEITYRCGFNSESGFCNRFRKTFGMTPKEYREV